MKKNKKRKLPIKKQDKTLYLIIAISIAFIAILIGTMNPQEDKWIQEGDILTKGDIVLEIGDYYEYDETNNGKEENINDVSWKVLGLDEKGNLMIVSATNVGTQKLGDKENIEETRSIYASGYKILDSIAALYGKGEHVINARSITIEDINKLTGYDVEKARREDNELNLEVTYYWDGTANPIYEISSSSTGKINIQHEKFVWFNQDNNTWNISEKSTTATTNDKEKIITGKNNWYSYSNGEGENQLLKVDSKKYNMIFDTSNDDSAAYWLASPYTIANEYYMAFGYFTVEKNSINYSNLVYSNDQPLEKELGVRVVVTLDI